MKSLITRALIAAFGLTLATAPLAASADQWNGHVSYHSGGGVAVHAGYSDGWHGGGWHGAPAPAWHRDGGSWRGGSWHGGYWGGGSWHGYGGARYVDGYYGWAPGGFYGYYWHGRWFAHRRWGNGFWIYF